MKDIIYREDALKHIKKRLYETAMNNIHSSGTPSDAYADVAEYRLDIWVSELPSADRTGKWIRLYRDGFGNLIGHCDKCGRKYPVDNFCPHCGARMVKE